MKKLSNKKGFTLMEMLIVVAIIAILVAISIPAFSDSLDEASRATDAANLRSAKALYVVKNMKGEYKDVDASAKYYYDVIDGDFKAYTDSSKIPEASLGSCTNHAQAWITIDFAAGEVKWDHADWTDKGYPGDCKTEVTFTTPEPPAGGGS